MSQTPFMPLWVSDFIGDTLDLNAEELGAYMLLLMAMWQWKGTLPDDDEKLRRVARCEPKAWRPIWATLRRFFTIENGQIYNKRLSEEYGKTTAKIEANRVAGAKGGAAKALKYNNAVLANATNSPYQPEPYPEPERKKQEKRARERALLSEFESFWNGWPNKVGKPKALTAFITARKAHSLQNIIAGRDRYVRDKPPDRPWLNPATFLNQERFNDQPAETGDGSTELPKWEGPDDPDTQGVLRHEQGLDQGNKAVGERSVLYNKPNGDAEGMGRVVSLFSQ